MAGCCARSSAHDMRTHENEIAIESERVTAGVIACDRGDAASVPCGGLLRTKVCTRMTCTWRKRMRGIEAQRLHAEKRFKSMLFSNKTAIKFYFTKPYQRVHTWRAE